MIKRNVVLSILLSCFFFVNVAHAQAKDWWTPHGVLRWDWQLQSPHDFMRSVDVIGLDVFDTDAKTVQLLKARGVRVICYINVGAWENWRSDAHMFPSEVIGNDYDGWDGEKWLDIRQIKTLAPIIGKRLDICAGKGFDGVEPDNMDSFWEDTGFDLTRQDQLSYNLWLAEQAHARGLSIGQKNAPDLAGDLAPYFDWAMTEDCFADEWCEEMQSYIKDRKSVFAAEYTDNIRRIDAYCEHANAAGFSLILKTRDLDKWIETCGR
ncbi:MAG: endo alpha-1,4 polygalactosaminidase [Alphaproteobacteria bacterium]